MFERLRSIFNKPATSFQVLSDLHLEINQQYPSFAIPVCAPHLILAGDIGRLVDYDNYRDFLQRQTDQFELVFLVLGNHEFYNHITFEEGLQRARQLEQEPAMNERLILLHQRRYDIPESRVTVLGCTLWSSVPDESKGFVGTTVQDFKQIEGWTIDRHNESHVADMTWLQSEIESIISENQTRNEKQSILVVTHHAPSLQDTSSPQHTNSPWSSAFATDVLSQIPKSSGIKAWVFGHTHYTTEFKRRGIQVLANQRGYVLPGIIPTGPEDRFNIRKVIHI